MQIRVAVSTPTDNCFPLFKILWNQRFAHTSWLKKYPTFEASVEPINIINNMVVAWRSKQAQRSCFGSVTHHKLLRHRNYFMAFRVIYIIILTLLKQIMITIDIAKKKMSTDSQPHFRYNSNVNALYWSLYSSTVEQSDIRGHNQNGQNKLITITLHKKSSIIEKKIGQHSSESGRTLFRYTLVLNIFW